jgi:osmotically-inducible protein OsmY
MACAVQLPTRTAFEGKIMKYRATMKLLSAAALTALALLASSAAGAYEARAGTEARAGAADQQLKDDVDNALSADPYFYGAHVITSVENGSVVLRGFVFSDWDLRDAIRIATKAAGGRRVVDDLSIEVGGRR